VRDHIVDWAPAYLWIAFWAAALVVLS